MRVSDLVEQPEIALRDLWVYIYPTQEELARAKVTGLFLGYFVPWDGWSNAYIAQTHGFETYPHFVEGSAANYENLDNAQTGIHDYFKYLKFAFGRATDLACSYVRRGRLERREAASLVLRSDGRLPHQYLGYSLDTILACIGISVGAFHQICDRFTNRALFQTDPKGTLIRRSDGSPLRLNEPA